MVPQNRIFPGIFLSLLFVGLIVLADQLVKLLVVNSDIPYVCNLKFAFGLGSEIQIINALIPGLLVAVAGFYAFKSQTTSRRFALILVIGGGVANMVDRVIFGCVRDFIDLKFWPIFNLADTAICIGAVLFVFRLINDRKNI